MVKKLLHFKGIHSKHGILGEHLAQLHSQDSFPQPTFKLRPKKGLGVLVELWAQEGVGSRVLESERAEYLQGPALIQNE